jgi:hypothetical protein
MQTHPAGDQGNKTESHGTWEDDVPASIQNGVDVANQRDGAKCHRDQKKSTGLRL